MSRRYTPPKVHEPAVTLAYVHGAEVAHSWHRSLVELLLTDLCGPGRIMRGGFIAVRYSTGGIVKARNDAVAMFLAAKDSDWLLWIDTDMGFGADLVERLLAVADPVERPIVGALAFGFREVADDGLHGYVSEPIPTVMDWVTVGDKSGFLARMDYERDAVVRCSGTGSACVLVHRSVFERLGDAPYDQMRNPSTGGLLGEDLAFCARAAAADIPVHVHTGVHTSHLKPIWVGEAHHLMWAGHRIGET